MANFLVLATGWGARYGGINSFNEDFCRALSNHLGDGGRVFCALFRPTADDVQRAASAGIELVAVDRPVDASSYDHSWSHEVLSEYRRKAGDLPLHFWVGHDVISGHAAVEGPGTSGFGKSILIMHMAYLEYQSFKAGVGAIAGARDAEQRELFERADHLFAVGPLLRDHLRA